MPANASLTHCAPEFIRVDAQKREVHRNRAGSLKALRVLTPFVSARLEIEAFITSLKSPGWCFRLNARCRLRAPRSSAPKSSRCRTTRLMMSLAQLELSASGEPDESTCGDPSPRNALRKPVSLREHSASLTELRSAGMVSSSMRFFKSVRGNQLFSKRGAIGFEVALYPRQESL